MANRRAVNINRGRRHFVLITICAAFVLLVGRAVDLQVINKDFLQNQGDARYLRVVEVAANRGMITDRNGEPLAISTPVDSVWADPRELVKVPGRWSQLARVLRLDAGELRQRLADYSDREFMYLKRHVDPATARRVQALGVAGVSLQREYRRYYPAAEVAAHVVGFTNIDDVGQEGMELTYNKWLSGTPGSKRVIKDRLGRIVENVESITEPVPGKDLALSIDRRIQYLAYRELKSAVRQYQARSGSVVVLDTRSGQVLAMVNQPSYNPNNRSGLHASHMRNRAVTDVFEPGSTIKAFTIAAALESGAYSPHTMINTAPGRFRVGNKTIHDLRDHGLIDVSTVIQKSSNVGASKIALSMAPKRLWRMFSKAGFGGSTGSGFPGEAHGHLSDYWRWNKIEQATLSFGYGLSVTPLQLARAYSVLADGGHLKPVSFVQKDDDPRSERVISPKSAHQVRNMLEAVVAEGGTGTLAQIPGYRVAGKTGTVHKPVHGGYAEDRYIAIFAGMAPASNPRLVSVVVINEPGGEQYYGGQVAAPVFADVMSGALRLLDIPPDDLAPRPEQQQQPRHLRPVREEREDERLIPRQSPYEWQRGLKKAAAGVL